IFYSPYLPSHHLFPLSSHSPDLHSFPTRRSSDLSRAFTETSAPAPSGHRQKLKPGPMSGETDEDPTGHRYEYCLHRFVDSFPGRSEEHTSELQSRENLVCRLLLEKKNKTHLNHKK